MQGDRRQGNSRQGLTRLAYCLLSYRPWLVYGRGHGVVNQQRAWRPGALGAWQALHALCKRGRLA